LKRERVIIDIKTLDDAAKVEETVKTGYCDTIKDNLNVWIAVEEDIIDSYGSLSKKVGPKSDRALQEFATESKETLNKLRELLKSFEALGQQRENRVQKIRDLNASL
jgi:ABC-type transporter Mla subunit MlaD